MQVCVWLVAICLTACGDSLDQRRADVAEAGRDVMPFDLDATTHIFEKLEDGGLQTVVADADDPDQVALVRSHLSAEAARFARGDFSDPAAIHGAAMPGLQALAAGHARLSIVYRDVERGAEIRYRADDPALVQAIHQWFDAQQRDHGHHAQE
jgi:hypothetical protein